MARDRYEADGRLSPRAVSPCTSWIHLIHYRLRVDCRLVHIIPYSQSFVFKYVEKLPDDLMNESYSASAFSTEEVDLALHHSINLTMDEQTQATIAAAKVMHYNHNGDLAKARIEFDRIMPRGFPLVQDIKLVQALLNG
jgi:hypothetical protein